ncbi:MAG: transcription antitermination factor NusB [Dehalococcoidia bacterium]|nr:transcription antitermination factor NusB [Dehalococcoidia bacterium]
MTGQRRKARAVALQAMYEIDTTRHEAEEVLGRLLAEENLSGDNTAFVRQMVKQVVEHQTEIDGNIQRFAPTWPVEQLSAIDRNILRLAISEILFDNRVIIKVAINEAVELAKKFGSESSSKFVNGVLGSISALAERR